MSNKTVFRAIVKELIRNAEPLSKKKYSGVHRIEDYMDSGKPVYRIHISDVLARSLSNLIDTREIDFYIQDIPKVRFDQPSLWFTIEAK